MTETQTKYLKHLCRYYDLLCKGDGQALVPNYLVIEAIPNTVSFGQTTAENFKLAEIDPKITNTECWQVADYPTPETYSMVFDFKTNKLLLSMFVEAIKDNFTLVKTANSMKGIDSDDDYHDDYGQQVPQVADKKTVKYHTKIDQKYLEVTAYHDYWCEHIYGVGHVHQVKAGAGKLRG